MYFLNILMDYVCVSLYMCVGVKICKQLYLKIVLSKTSNIMIFIRIHFHYIPLVLLIVTMYNFIFIFGIKYYLTFFVCFVEKTYIL